MSPQAAAEPPSATGDNAPLDQGGEYDDETALTPEEELEDPSPSPTTSDTEDPTEAESDTDRP